MQLDISAFDPKPVATTIRELPLPMPGEPRVLHDEARVREGDILPPSLSTLSSTPALTLNRTPLALRAIDPKTLSSRTELMVALSLNLPLNEFNLPKFIYRADLLDYTVFTVQNPSKEDFDTMQEALDAALVPLSYYEGYPCLPDGTPFWEKLDGFESVAAADLFKAYKSLPGARQLSLVSGSSNLQNVQELYHQYYWAQRCLAHDTFAVAHYQRLREQRILSSENVHFLEAEKLLTELQLHFKDLDWAKVTDPTVFVGLLEKIQKVQRTALQLDSKGQEKAPQPQSLELIMRKITSANTSAQEESKETANALELLSDPELAGQAQELIIRMSR